MSDVGDVRELERTARTMVDDGVATSDVRLALDQLVADRTNGEPLDDAAHRLREALGGGERQAGD